MAISILKSNSNSINPLIYILLFFLNFIILVSLYIVAPEIVLISSLFLIVLSAILIYTQGVIWYIIISSPFIMLLTRASTEYNLIRITITISIVFIALLRYWLENRRFHFFPKKLINPYLVFIIYVFCILFISVNPIKSAYDWLHLVYYLLISFCVYNVFRPDKHLFGVLSVTIVLFALIASSLILTNGIGIFRIGFLGINPNMAAILLTLATGYCIFTVLNKDTGHLKFLAISTLILCSLAVILTGSRGGWLAFFVFTMVFLWKAGNKKIVIASVITAITVAILFILNISQFADLAQKARVFGGMTGRPELWNGGLKVIANYPIFGTGMGCVGEVLRYHVDMANPLIPLFTHIPVLGGKLHNGYLQALAEFGIVGFLIIVFINYRIMRYFWHINKYAASTLLKTASAFGIAILIMFYCRALYESSVPYGIINDNLIVLVSLALIVKIIERSKIYNERIVNQSESDS